MCSFLPHLFFSPCFSENSFFYSPLFVFFWSCFLSICFLLDFFISFFFSIMCFRLFLLVLFSEHFISPSGLVLSCLPFISFSLPRWIFSFSLLFTLTLTPWNGMTLLCGTSFSPSSTLLLLYSQPSPSFENSTLFLLLFFSHTSMITSNSKACFRRFSVLYEVLSLPMFSFSSHFLSFPETPTHVFVYGVLIQLKILPLRVFFPFLQFLLPFPFFLVPFQASNFSGLPYTSMVKFRKGNAFSNGY